MSDGTEDIIQQIIDSSAEFLKDTGGTSLPIRIGLAVESLFTTVKSAEETGHYVESGVLSVATAAYGAAAVQQIIRSGGTKAGAAIYGGVIALVTGAVTKRLFEEPGGYNSDQVIRALDSAIGVVVSALVSSGGIGNISASQSNQISSTYLEQVSVELSSDPTAAAAAAFFSTNQSLIQESATDMINQFLSPGNGDQADITISFSGADPNPGFSFTESTLNSESSAISSDSFSVTTDPIPNGTVVDVEQIDGPVVGGQSDSIQNSVTNVLSDGSYKDSTTTSNGNVAASVNIEATGNAVTGLSGYVLAGVTIDGGGSPTLLFNGDGSVELSDFDNAGGTDPGESAIGYPDGSVSIFRNDAASGDQAVIEFGPNQAIGDTLFSFDYTNIASDALMFGISNSGTVAAYTAILNGGTVGDVIDRLLNPLILFSGDDGKFVTGIANVPSKSPFSVINFHQSDTISIANFSADIFSDGTFDVSLSNGGILIDVDEIQNVSTFDSDGNPISVQQTITLTSENIPVISYNGYVPSSVSASIIGNGNLDIVTSSVSPPPCFVIGTRILLAHGGVLVEELHVGDWVHTLSRGLSEVNWIGHRRVDCRRHPKSEAVWPVRIRTGSFGKDLPRRDLLLSPDHAVFVDGVLIPIKHLINGCTVVQEPCDEVTYYHVELEQHDIIFAEGLPAESYLDSGDRSNFENGGVPLRLHPDLSALTWEAKGCAPLIVTGPILATVRARLLQRAATLASRLRPRRKTNRAA